MRFQLPLTPYSCLPFFFGLLSRYLCTQYLSWQKYSHISRTYCSFPIIFQSLPRCAFAPRTLSTANLSAPFASDTRELLRHFWHKLVVYDSFTFLNHHRRQLPEAEDLFAALVVTAKPHFMRVANCTCFLHSSSSSALFPFPYVVLRFSSDSTRITFLSMAGAGSPERRSPVTREATNMNGRSVAPMPSVPERCTEKREEFVLCCVCTLSGLCHTSTTLHLCSWCS